MMVGLPGSGKTFFAQQFADTFGAPFIDAAYVEERGRDEQASGELNAMFLNEIARTNQTFIYEGDSLSRTHRTDFARWRAPTTTSRCLCGFRSMNLLVAAAYRKRKP